MIRSLAAFLLGDQRDGQTWGIPREGRVSSPCLNSVSSNCPTDTKSNLRGNGTGEVVSIRSFRDVSQLPNVHAPLVAE